ncbi:MAG: Tyrosyl-tRNA synthetase [Candidatus Yanofskybacteria bacterium GW2011_GWC2_41_9]|uniref:Tyrosine--tRNA ligase n=1 Tax=Candidatus Yanofskybacteria bacterium GW2011_GWC2_41_9 TaxID=1619029 RepID=A0A0G0XTE5_9BACT|nr:MAG: Tyrosyl-tRNA synthetase [Candidatus Yanofskybacteria bacterium GW2011_GWC2_41_9]
MFGNKIKTDENKINEILSRGVDRVEKREHLEKRLREGKKLRVKLGIDPTSQNIHIGRAVALWKLRAFQELGHQAILIIGDFTAQIGDTSDKSSERPMLSEEQVKTNMKTYFDQAFKILDKDKTETFYNSEWLKKLCAIDISKMADAFGLHEFEAREVISRRIKEGKRVSLREVLYPLFQGYDSVKVSADVELGGSDQWFNLLAGRSIQPLYGQQPQDILTTHLLEGTDKRKMSSSWGNVINITDEPNDMFGKVMRIYDGEDGIVIRRYLERATMMSMEEVRKLEQELKTGANPRDIKKRLAEEIVSLYYSVKVAREASDEWEKVFSNKELPSEMEEAKASGTVTTVIAGVFNVSNSEIKRLINEKAISVNGEAVSDWHYEVKKGDIIKVGSRRFVKIV